MDRRRLGQEKANRMDDLSPPSFTRILLKSKSKQAAFVHLMNVKHLQKGIEFRPGRR